MRFVHVCTILIFWLAAGCGFAQDMTTVVVEGTAMSPTIKDGDSIKIDRAAYKSQSAVKRFDIVSFFLNEEQKRDGGWSGEVFYTKRLIGLPGEEIEIRQGQTFINGKLLEEPFIETIWNEDNFGPIKVPTGEYFALGDNRAYSFDSRSLKPSTIKAQDIRGKVVEIVRAQR